MDADGCLFMRGCFSRLLCSAVEALLGRAYDTRAGISYWGFLSHLDGR